MSYPPRTPEEAKILPAGEQAKQPLSLSMITLPFLSGILMVINLGTEIYISTNNTRDSFHAASLAIVTQANEDIAQKAPTRSYESRQGLIKVIGDFIEDGSVACGRRFVIKAYDLRNNIANKESPEVLIGQRSLALCGDKGEKIGLSL